MFNSQNNTLNKISSKHIFANSILCKHANRGLHAVISSPGQLGRKDNLTMALILPITLTIILASSLEDKLTWGRVATQHTVDHEFMDGFTEAG